MKSLRCAIQLALIGFLLAGCGGPAAADLAVCDAYQHLVDVWPSNSEEVEAVSSIDELWGTITAAGEALVTAGEAAETEELKEAAVQVGEYAAGFVERNADLVAQGFAPFFNENMMDESGLGLLCEGIGRPIALP